MEIVPKVYKISPTYNESLSENGFTIAKSCGQGIDGFKHAIAIGYLEGLALKRGFHSNNLIFLYTLLNKLQEIQEINEVFNVITQIQHNQITQNEIVKIFKTSETFRAQLTKFSEFLFQIPENYSDNIESLMDCNKFTSSLSELNIQLQFYNNTGTRPLKPIIKASNQYIHPIMILVLFNSGEDQKVFNLYKKDYEIVAESNLNTSMIYNEEPKDDCLVEKLEDVLRLLEEINK